MKPAKKITVRSGMVYFHLTATTMTEKNPHPYSATRANIKKAFKRADFIPYTLTLGTPTHLEAHIERGSDTIRIGCKRFSGKSYLKLKKWALGGK